MELLSITKKHILVTTGFTVGELLSEKPKVDSRLSFLRRKRVEKPDLLVRGNPQLMLGYVTSIDEVDNYFKMKEKVKDGIPVRK